MRLHTDYLRHNDMNIQPIPPDKPQPTFGIYLRTRKTPYGHCDIGRFRGANIEIYHDYQEKTKLYYVSDSLRNWLKSKLIYFEKGIQKILRSEAQNRTTSQL